MISQAFDDFFAVDVCVYFYSILVERKQVFVEHDDATVDDNGANIGRFGRVNERRIDVEIRHL